MAKTQKQIDWYNQWRKTPEGKAKMKLAVLKWKTNNPEKYKESNRRTNLKILYDISLEGWNALFLSQDSKCAICFSEKPRGRNWHTDHCHTTGKIRGILCGWCNTGIGKLQESPVIMERAMKYLKEKYV